MRKRSGIFDGKTVLPVTAASFAMVFLIMSMLLTSFQAVIYGDPNYRFYEKEYEKYYYTQFYAGCVLISIPIAIVFLLSQRCYVEGVAGAVKG